MSMKPIRALRRLLANTDRVNDLLAATERTREAIDNLTDRFIERMDRVNQALDNQATSANERLDRLYQAADNQASAINERLDRLYQTADNQSTSTNERLDRLYETSDHLAGDLNKRLDQLVETVTNQSTGANERLEAVVKAITNQSTASNLRLDRVISAVRGSDDSTKIATSQADLAPVGAKPSPVLALKGRAAQDDTTAQWLDSSPAPLPLPRWSKSELPKGANGGSIPVTTNALQRHQPLLKALEPWSGPVPKGYLVDFLGILTDAHFRALYGIDPAKTGGTYVRTEIPQMHGENGEWWFETINWLEAAHEAREHFVMITLGASYGAQAVGAYRALQIINPLPCKLVAVEPVPENCLWVRKHFRDNGIDPEAHWLINAAISDRNTPVFFPIGGAGSGANNCMSTDTPAERKILAEQLIVQGKAGDTLRNLMLNNTTGVIKDLLPDQGVTGEIELVSAVTLRDVLSAFDRVDYLEADIQQSEIRVFPPFIDLLKKKVRRIHIGTHGKENHEMLVTLFKRSGWEIVFDYPPNGTFNCELGSFELNDGVLTVLNPAMRWPSVAK